MVVAPEIMAMIMKGIFQLFSKEPPRQPGTVEIGHVGEMQVPDDLFGGFSGTKNAVSEALSQNPYIAAQAQVAQNKEEVPSEQVAGLINSIFSSKSNSPTPAASSKTPSVMDAGMPSRGMDNPGSPGLLNRGAEQLPITGRSGVFGKC